MLAFKVMPHCECTRMHEHANAAANMSLFTSKYRFFSRPTADRRKREATLLHCWLTFRWQVSEDVPKENRNLPSPDCEWIWQKKNMCETSPVRNLSPRISGWGTLVSGCFSCQEECLSTAHCKKIALNVSAFSAKEKNLRHFRVYFRWFSFFSLGFGNHLYKWHIMVFRLDCLCCINVTQPQDYLAFISIK